MDPDLAAATPPMQGQEMAIQDIDNALQRLRDDQREVVLLVGLEALSYKETAEVLGIPVGTVMSRLSRGRENLRRLMQAWTGRCGSCTCGGKAQISAHG